MKQDFSFCRSTRTQAWDSLPGAGRRRRGSCSLCLSRTVIQVPPLEQDVAAFEASRPRRGCRAGSPAAVLWPSSRAVVAGAGGFSGCSFGELCPSRPPRFWCLWLPLALAWLMCLMGLLPRECGIRLGQRHRRAAALSFFKGHL